MGQGRLIVFEGVEGSGKSTQLRRLVASLEQSGADVLALREPGGTPLGDDVRRIVLDMPHQIVPAAEALLFMASRAQLVEAVIRPALEQGKIIVLDRFMLSTFAYQVAGRGLEQRAVAQANLLATGGVRPDLTLLLELSAAEGLRRAAARSVHDRIERADATFHERVARGFSEFASTEWQSRNAEAGPIVRIDANGDPDVVFGRIRDAVTARWPETLSRNER